jgi:radical SAM protein with 4Fe4S-binding SPASM domain
MFRTLSAPINLQVEITEKCMHKCRHCYNYFRHNDDKCHTLSHDSIRLIADEIIKNKVSRIVVTGGEPLVESEKAINFASRLSTIPWISIFLNSNLVLFNERVGKRLLETGIKVIMTSLIADDPKIHDWVTQRPGSWNKTVEGIKLAKKLGYRVLVNMVLTKWNIDRVYQTGKFVSTLGVDKFGATRACAPTPLADSFESNLISIDQLRESLRQLYQLKEECGYEVDVLEHYPWCALGDLEKYQYLSRRKCLAGVTSASIGADGQLRPCGHSSKKYGSVLEEGLSAVWAKMSDWRNQQYVGVCKDCKYLKLCTGGCAVEAENSGKWKDHHCVGEEGVTRLPPQKTPTRLVSLDDQLCVPNHTGFRQEEFGGIMFSGNGGVALLDKQSYPAMQKLADEKFFTARQLVESFKFEENKTLQTLSFLLEKNLIRKT